MSTQDKNTKSIYINNIMDILEANEDCIEENFNNKEDLVAINKKLRDKIFLFLKNKDEGINKKELVRHILREYFELQERDIIVIRDNDIIIKLLDEQSLHEVTEEEKNTIANRYNGINEDDLVSFYNDIFLQEDSEDFFFFIAQEYVNKHLIFKRLDNQNYEKNVFSSIQNIITDQLVEDFDHNEEFFRGFSGYIFRIHFKEVFEFIAELILIKLSESNDYIIEFLKYYSMSVVIVNGKRYKVPEIQASNGWKWNVSSMAPVIKVYVRAEEILDKLNKNINLLEKKATQLYVHDLSPVAYNNTLNKELEKIRQEMVYNNSRLDKHIATLKDDQSNQSLKLDIQNIRQELQDFRADLTRLESKLVKKDTILKYTDLKRDIDTKVRQQEREEKVIETNQDSFYSIVDALVKALTSKKTLIK